MIDHEARRLRDFVLDELAALRNARHAPARGIEVLGLDPLEKQRDGARVLDDRHAEGLGDGVGGDVVMRRADAAGGEDVVERGAHLVDGADDDVLDVGDDARFAETHAPIVELPGQVLKIGVLRAAGENLVADDDDGGGVFGLGGAHSHSLRRKASA